MPQTRTLTAEERAHFARNPTRCMAAIRAGVPCREEYVAVFENLEDPGYCRLCAVHAFGFLRDVVGRIATPVRHWSRADWEASGRQAILDAAVAAANPNPTHGRCVVHDIAVPIGEDCPYCDDEGADPELLQQEPDVWMRIEVTTHADGSATIHTETNDNDDDGFPGPVERWANRYRKAEDAIRHAGKSRIGISGIRVSVFIDGVQV